MFSSFEGIKIYLYPHDHNPPHFHVYYGEYEAIIEIRTIEVLAGNLPKRQLKKVIKWAKIVQEQLLSEFIRLQER